MERVPLYKVFLCVYMSVLEKKMEKRLHQNFLRKANNGLVSLGVVERIALDADKHLLKRSCYPPPQR